jgi:uncharacterized LabA/DUF88 family protein
LSRFADFLSNLTGGVRRGAAVFIDFENLALALREGSGGTAPELAGILTLARQLASSGRIEPVRAYADWTHFENHRDTLDRAGVQTVQADASPVHGKNSTDIRMAVDMIDLMHAQPKLSAFVLVTGDSDFTPVVERLRQRRRRVIGVGVRGSVSRKLIDACDQFHYHSDLLSEEAGVEPAADAGAKAPPRPASAPAARGDAEPAREKPAETAEPPDTGQPPRAELGLEEGATLPSSRLKELIPLAAESWRSVQPRYVSEMRKALSLRHRGKISAQEAAILANLLHATGGYGGAERPGWLVREESRSGESAFDLLLAAARRTLREDGSGGANEPLRIALLITGERLNGREVHMRMARGDRWLDELYSDGTGS